jgi:hypothetical protein
MHARQILIAALLLVGGAGIAVAQTSTSPEQPRRGAATQYSDPANPYSSTGDVNSNVVNPYANSVAPHRSTHNPYFNKANPYASTATPGQKPPGVNPAEAAATRQSGVTDADARSLLQQQGYTGINGLHADPNSIWVWQADALKNGRRVRLGIDYRGNLLELGASAQPCISPGAGFGAGPLGTGARLSEADRCSSR